MIAAIASGKGGTGKTTVTASLASVWPEVFARRAVAVDLDVEEPNLHLFLKPEFAGSQTAFQKVPTADESKCDYCRKCAELCQFKAINVLGENLLIFPEMCHACGGCLVVCPRGVLTPGSRDLGEVSWGPYRERRVRQRQAQGGRGHESAPDAPGQGQGKRNFTPKKAAMCSSTPPPGVSCPAMNAVKDSQAILLVTEPTPFGFHDLKLAWEAFSPLERPMGVVINRAGWEHQELNSFCESQSLPILARIPYDRKAAEMYAKGHILADISLEFRRIFLDLARDLAELQSGGKGPVHD